MVYVVSYDHGGLVLWGYEHFLQHLRDTLGWLDRHPKLKMGLDNEAWTYDWLAENRPAVLAELRQALQHYQGRFGIATCTYGQPLAAFLLEESNIRQIALGIETTRACLGYEVSVYAFSEHAAFPQLPQVLAGLGIRRALLRSHFLMYGYCPGYDLPIAWWEAPDGSRVACVPTYVHQERQVADHRAQPPGPFGLTTEDTWILTRLPEQHLAGLAGRPSAAASPTFSRSWPRGWTTAASSARSWSANWMLVTTTAGPLWSKSLRSSRSRQQR